MLSELIEEFFTSSCRISSVDQDISSSGHLPDLHKTDSKSGFKYEPEYEPGNDSKSDFKRASKYHSEMILSVEVVVDELEGLVCQLFE